MARKTSYLLLCLLLITVSTVPAQHDTAHEKDIRPFSQVTGIPTVSYGIQADIVPESLLVRGYMDIAYRNDSRDTLREMYLDLGRDSYPIGAEISFYDSAAAIAGRYCHVDSVLYQAARLDDKPIMVTGRLMKLTLPSGLPPGEIAPLIVSFTTRHQRPMARRNQSDFLRLNDWFPQVAVYRHGWVLPSEKSNEPAGGEWSRFSITIRIDSAYTIIAPGHFFNEKLHYGTFEQGDNDTVFVDVLSHLFAFDKRQVYEPVFEDGIKRYFFRLHSGTDFPLLLADDLRLDRAYLDSLVFEVYYQPTVAEHIKYRVADIARTATVALQKRFGVFPSPKIVLTGQRRYIPSTCREAVIMVPVSLDEKLLYPFLTFQIARQWFANIVPPTSDSITAFAPAAFDDGLAWYVTTKILHDSLGAQGYALTYDLAQWLDFNGYRCKSDERFFDDIFRTIPARLYMLDVVLGDNLLDTVITECTDLWHHRPWRLTDFENVTATAAGRDPAWFFEQWFHSDAHLDYYLTDVTYDGDAEGGIVSGNIANGGKASMAVEIAAVLHDDRMVLDTIDIEDFDPSTGSARLSITVPGKPRSVVIDPNHFLLDTRRDNNVFSFRRNRARYQEPDWLFPALRK